MKPVVLPSGEGEVISIAGTTIEIKAGAAGTDGKLGLVEYTAHDFENLS